ncbi:8664_t:CDS:1, partial [Racocetra persica]
QIYNINFAVLSRQITIMVKILKEKKHQIDNSSNSNSESSNEPTGHSFTGIWREIELGKEVSHGVYKGKYIHCNKEFKHVKFIKTRAYIAYKCSSCPKHIKQYYNYIITNNLFDDPNVENYTIPIIAVSEVKSLKSTAQKKI